MRKLLIMAALLFSPLAFSEANDNPLPIDSVKFEFNSTWQQVERSNPGGTAWPSQESKIITYTVSPSEEAHSDPTSIKLVNFVFSQENKLTIVFIHFDHSERDSVKDMLITALGDPQSVKEETGEQSLSWVLNDGRYVVLSLGRSPSPQWVYIGIKGARSVE